MLSVPRIVSTDVKVSPGVKGKVMPMEETALPLTRKNIEFQFFFLLVVVLRNNYVNLFFKIYIFTCIVYEY